MAIPQTKYVDTTSIVGVSNVINPRALILRLFTINDLLTTGDGIEFTDADQVKNYFGETSEEYFRALKYFKWISKTFTQATKLSFSRWLNAPTNFKIYGAQAATLAVLKTITTGQFAITYNDTDFLINGLDFSAATTFAGIADILQTKIRTLSDPAFTTAVVAYNPINMNFIIVGSSTTIGVIKIKITTADLNTPVVLGLVPQSISGSPGAIWNNAGPAETLTACLNNSVDRSNNFGSFVFMPDLTLDQHVEIANWLKNADSNVLYQYHLRVVTYGAAQAARAALKNFAGVGVHLTVPNDFLEQFAGTILAAINFYTQNGTVNFMYSSGDFVPSVKTKTLSDSLDALNVNYYGQTQVAGQEINFYQRGVLMGTASDPRFMNIYANEQWLKNAVTTELFNYLAIAPKLSANRIGVAQVLAILQSVINDAIFNGTISTTSDLTREQKAYITVISGDDVAWRQVQNDGFYKTAEIKSLIINGLTEYYILYLLIYKKDDVVNKIEGKHVLI